ncbi:MAG: alanine dehydrogenase [Gammaproteobacteria bacterium]|nr:alanine dehydrogenase [Gammaproteobacteria bacterium]
MRIGIPKEIKTLEGRIALIPDAVADLVQYGHDIFIEHDAGVPSGYSDADFRQAGAQIVPDARALYDAGEIIVKVKEPQPSELALLRSGQILFSYLHLAAEIQLMKALQQIGLTAVAFETVQLPDGQLPLLAPMSDIAGRISVQVGAHLLHSPQGGRGILLGGLPAAERGRVVILGAGVAGGNAALYAANIGSEVVVFDRQRNKLEHMRALGNNVTALYPYQHSLAEHVKQADLLVGAILVAGERAKKIVTADMVRSMKKGSVIVDISVDQGGCVETTRPTNYQNPTFEWEGVVHFGVTNMPGAVPHTASQALSASLLPYVLRLAGPDWERQPDLAAGINVKQGKIVHPALQKL